MPNTNLFDKFLRGSRLHEHPDPAQRVLGVSSLSGDAQELVQLLGDPSAEVRQAAAARCTVPAALAAALQNENEPSVREALAHALGEALGTTPDDAVRALLAGAGCTDSVRVQVALRSADEATRRAAIEAIVDSDLLVDVALRADHAALRTAAAERVHAPASLERLLEGARDKDRGIARLARDRLQSIQRRHADGEAADAILQEAEALVAQPGGVVMAAVELDRRWRALDLADDVARRARWEAINVRLRERFDRERDEERARAQFERRLNEWLAILQTPAANALPALREELTALRAEAVRLGDAEADERLRSAEQQLQHWEEAAPRLAAAEALVLEAEELAAATTIDDAGLPARWQALEAEARTPALTQRLEAALAVIEQRRAAIARAHQEEQGAARHELHAVLHTAEQAVAAGQLQEARAAVDRTRGLKALAGVLPKPTVQRLSRVVNQLIELERWQQFGQQSARMQLCERAEGLGQKALAPAALAREVQQLRAEWKKLDEQQPGVPKSLWERFDGACERAYAPAAKHFAELAAQHKAARRQRDEFIAAASAQGAAMLEGPPDWRALEHWLRDTEATWRGKTLGSVEPAVWKKQDAKLKEALAPARAALRAARDAAIREREALIAEAQALLAKAAERDVPGQVKELQARWQAQARSIVLQQKDERGLWERFRAAFQSVFDARAGQRKESDERRTAHRRVFETLCERLEQLVQRTDADEADLRRARHELQEEWRKAARDGQPPHGAVEARFKAALGKVDHGLRARGRREEEAMWRALLEKERLCEELDGLVAGEEPPDPAKVEATRHRWAELPALVADWERPMAERREAAIRALGDDDERYDHAGRIRAASDARRDTLLELELMLGIESPPDLKAQRLAVQVRELRDRFKRTASGAADTGPQLLLKWCALPGVAAARDRIRCEAIVARLVRA